MKAVLILAVLQQLTRAAAVKSGPLPQCTYVGWIPVWAMMSSNTATTSGVVNELRGMMANTLRVYSSKTDKEPDVAAFGGDIRLKIEADHVHGILRG